MVAYGGASMVNMVIEYSMNEWWVLCGELRCLLHVHISLYILVYE